jgi:hypothetical protein
MVKYFTVQGSWRRLVNPVFALSQQAKWNHATSNHVIDSSRFKIDPTQDVFTQYLRLTIQEINKSKGL